MDLVADYAKPLFQSPWIASFEKKVLKLVKLGREPKTSFIFFMKVWSIAIPKSYLISSSFLVLKMSLKKTYSCSSKTWLGTLKLA